MNLLLATIVSYQIAAGLPLKHDGYVVERGTGIPLRQGFHLRQGYGGRDGGQDGERALVVKAATARAFLYANYESNRWMNAASYPFVRDPHFRFRALDVSRSSEPLREWIAATGANAVYLKRGRPDAKRLRECAELGVPAYGFLYGCDAAKWNRAKYDAFVAAHPSARGVTPPKSWEKGTLCPSDPATEKFFEETILELVGRVVPTRRGGLGTDRPTKESCDLLDFVGTDPASFVDIFDQSLIFSRFFRFVHLLQYSLDFLRTIILNLVRIQSEANSHLVKGFLRT